MAKQYQEAYKKNGFLREIAPFFFIAVIFLMVGFFLHPFYMRYAYPTPPSIDVAARGEIKRFRRTKFTNPILECEVADKKDIKEFDPLNALIKQHVEAEINGKRASKISVYFRAMTSGRWGGINEDDIYPGESLLKVPLLLAYYKLAEENPEILNEQLLYKGDFDKSASQMTQPLEKIEAGKSYLINELIRRMIVYSGNNSTVLLRNRLDRQYLNGVFGDLGVPRGQDTTGQWLVSTKDFARFFRVLYSATYLSQFMSEKALTLLSQTEFREGIVAGVPPVVSVAHKFGEVITKNTKGQILSAVLHDCGIVYNRAHPYFLCVMTEGGDFEPLKGVIARISKAVYTFVDSPEYPKQPS